MFRALCNDYNFIHSLGIKSLSLEGFLFPDTYMFLKSYTEEDVITVLVNNLFKKYKNALKEVGRSKFTMEEIVMEFINLGIILEPFELHWAP